MNLDRRLLNLLNQVRLPLVLTLIAGSAGGVFTILQAFYLSKTIDGAFLKQRSLEALLPLLLLFVLFSILRSLFNWFSQAQAAGVAQSIKTDLRHKLTAHVFSLGPMYTLGQQSGELSNTMLNGVEALEAYFSQYIPQLILAAVIPLSILFFVFPVDLLSGFVLLFTAPLIPVFMMLIGHMAQEMTNKQWKTLSRMSAYFLDVLQGLTTLKLLGQSKKEAREINRISDLFRQTTMNVLKIAFLSALVLEMAATISTAVIAVEIGLRLMYAKMEFQPALFILILAPEFYQPLRLLGTRFHAGMEGVSAAQRIFNILEQKDTLIKNGTGSLPEKAQYTITFSDVNFSYDSDKPALKDICFTLPAGSKTALIGPSGSGKTTISRLLLRFIEAEKGEILIGDQALENIPLKEWRKHISWLPQNPYLFNDTVRANIALAAKKATADEIECAARQANAHDFIQNLPQGYETVIGERGMRLSGGQAQRLALARAFLRNAPLLIFDEPTSNLDPQTEEEIRKTILSLSKDKTTLIIAHRLNTIQSVDQVIILANGRIIERGSPHELRKRKGPYAEMLNAFGEQPL